MNHPACHLADAIVTATASIATIAPLLAATPNSELLLLLLPLLGSVLMSGAAIMLNPEPETRKIVIGRSIIALLFGVTAPQLLGMFFERFDPVQIKPAVLVLLGAAFAFVAYIVSRSFFSQAYSRAAALAKIAADEIERRAGISTDKKT